MFFCLNFSKYNEPCSEKSSVLCLVVMHSFMVLTGKMKTQSNMRCTCELEEPNFLSFFSSRYFIFKMNLATEAKRAKLSCPQGPKVKKFAGEGERFPFFFYSLSSSLSSCFSSSPGVHSLRRNDHLAWSATARISLAPSQRKLT